MLTVYTLPISHSHHTSLGEEGEKKIVQVPARLYAFDLDTHTWKERGRGEIRLNDAAQSEGLFQSRLDEEMEECRNGK